MSVSPKPWRMDQDGRIVAYPDGLEASVFSHHLPDGEKENNKSEILKCVNAHDDLVKALHHLIRWHDQLSAKDIAMAKEALAKAGVSA